MATFLLVLTAVCAYFLGGINGAIISSRFIFKKDIRKYGSGNPGLTNFYRIFGVPGMAAVALIDIAKSVAAVAIGWGLLSIVEEPAVGKLFAGFSLMLGHTFPAFYQFKGGKGVLCGAVVAMMVNWRIGLICVIVFAAILVLTRYVSLSAIATAIVFPICVWAFGTGGLEGCIALFSTILLIVRHRDNIGRLLAGRERKLRFSSPPKPKYDDGVDPRA